MVTGPVRGAARQADNCTWWWSMDSGLVRDISLLEINTTRNEGSTALAPAQIVAALQMRARVVRMLAVLKGSSDQPDKQQRRGRWK